MSTKHRPFMFWVPRIFGILFAGFLSLFTFDAWEGASSFWEGLVGWLIHLLPVLIVLFVLAIAWGWPRLGGILFLLLAIGFVIFFASGDEDRWTDFAISLLVLSGPLVLLGILFLLESRKIPPEPSLQH